MLNFLEYRLIEKLYRRLARALKQHGLKLSADAASALHPIDSSGPWFPQHTIIGKMKGFKGGFVGEEEGVSFDIGIVGDEPVTGIEVGSGAAPLPPAATFRDDGKNDLQEFIDELFATGKAERTWRVVLTGTPHDRNIEEEDGEFKHEITVNGRNPIDAWRNAIKAEPNKFDYGIENARFEKDGLSASWQRGAPQDEEFFYTIDFTLVND